MQVELYKQFASWIVCVHSRPYLVCNNYAVSIGLAAGCKLFLLFVRHFLFALLTGWFSSQGRGPGWLFHVLNARDAQLALPRPEC